MKSQNQDNNTQVQQNHLQTLVMPCFLFTSAISQLFKIINQKHINKKLTKNTYINVKFQYEMPTQYIYRPQQWSLSSQKLSVIFSHYNFINLQLLFLGSIKLTNCQFLSFMNMPNLKLLNLVKSKLFNFAPLKKAILPKLQNLDVDIYFPQLLQFGRFQFLNKIQLSFYFHQIPQNDTIGDFSYLAKLQSQKDFTVNTYYLRNKRNKKQESRLIQKITQIKRVI